MNFTLETAQLYIPDDLPAEKALSRTTHLGISAHQDDLEIMAIDGILQCFQQSNQWFTGVVVTHGRGSPRNGLYADYTDDEMWIVRNQEQKKAAFIGDYAAQVLLDYPSSAVKDPADARPIRELTRLLRITRPQIIYTHNLADKHPTHIGVTLKTIAAIRALPPEAQPKHVYGCEVWRDLDWLPDDQKVAFDCSTQENLQMALVGVFDSQISGGKRYDLATMGRRRAHATYHASHNTDVSSGLVFAMDLTPLITDPTLDIAGYVQGFIDQFGKAITTRIKQMNPI